VNYADECDKLRNGMDTEPNTELARARLAFYEAHRLNAELVAALATYVAYDELINGPDGDPDTDRLQVAREAIEKAKR
jgi:hypothetical protein